LRVIGTGIDYSRRAPLFGAFDEQAFAAAILRSLEDRGELIRKLTRTSTTATTYRREVERVRTTDLGDPRLAGWCFLISEEDPRCDEIIRILRPLSKHRAMKDPESPVTFSARDTGPDAYLDWLIENYSPLDRERLPYYVLIVAGPDQIPFSFQSMLDSAAAVGRLDFESLDGLAVYVDKIMRLESSELPVCSRECLFFAPEHGIDDATYFSRRYMAEPLAEHVSTKCGFPVRRMFGKDADKNNLAECLRTTRAALVYTASHGLGAPDEPLEVQKRYNGAICCQNYSPDPMKEWLFGADDVPSDCAFLEGSVFFQFACFGYGTPAESDFAHWVGGNPKNADVDFVAALPKALLAHPKGPLAFVGHLDTAWLHGFDDPDDPHIIERWHPRIAPFVRSVETLLQMQPVGLAMSDMNKRYDLGNAQLASTYDRMQKKKIKLTPEFHASLVNAFITRNDAQNYMVFGDPAARLRIPEE
jgi:hypothetical protein